MMSQNTETAITMRLKTAALGFTETIHQLCNLQPSAARPILKKQKLNLAFVLKTLICFHRLHEPPYEALSMNKENQV